MRNKIKDREELSKTESNTIAYLDTMVNNYVEKFGLPSGFSSIEELKEEIASIMANPSCYIVQKIPEKELV